MNVKSQLLILIVAFPFLMGCEKDSNIGRFEDAIVEDDDNLYKFKQLTFTINITNNLNEYVLLGNIDSIKVKVNGKFWGVFKSESIDTTQLTDKIENDLRYSVPKINYLVIAPYLLKTDNIETAGDMVNYLNNRLVLTPGDYVCEISEIKFKNLKNEWIIQKPQFYKNFSVAENTTSSYAGEINVTLK